MGKLFGVDIREAARSENTLKTGRHVIRRRPSQHKNILEAVNGLKHTAEKELRQNEVMQVK